MDAGVGIKNVAESVMTKTRTFASGITSGADSTTVVDEMDEISDYDCSAPSTPGLNEELATVPLDSDIPSFSATWSLVNFAEAKLIVALLHAIHNLLLNCKENSTRFGLTELPRVLMKLTALLAVSPSDDVHELCLSIQSKL
jgi:hypothetical protein